MTTRIARCECGALTAACEGEPVRRSVCHCRSCQRRSGSAFSLNSTWAEAQVTISGESRMFERLGEEGHWGRSHFCTTCGTTLFWRIERSPGMVYVAVGGFADPAFPEPEVAVYGELAPPWVRFETAGPMRQH
ncbi:MAG TPA: GFA family protein [Allosphingosinicella sp.]|nr:GFA family protein [Allosphingosinicella sp.]